MSASARPRRHDDDAPAAVRRRIDAGDAAAAAELARTALERGDLPAEERNELRYALAVALRLARDTDAALETLAGLIGDAPDHARAWQERGHCHLAANRPDDAAQSFGRAARANPGLAVSWRALAELRQRLGDKRGAEYAQAQYRYLQSLPRAVAGAIELAHDGRLELAGDACRAHLRSHPRDVEGLRVLADIALRIGVYDEAHFLLESALELEPGHLAARSDFLKVLNRQGRYAEALREARRLVSAQAENPVFRLALANAEVSAGELDAGIDELRAVVEKAPNRAAAEILLGHALKTRGDRDDAVSAYRAAARHSPATGEAYWSLANVKTYRFDDAELAHIETRAEAPELPTDDRIAFRFAAGKAREDRGDDDRAFAHYRRGNELKRQTLGYSADVTSNLVDAQIETCTAALFERLAGAGFSDPAPIFIVGLPRAGSTLIEQILASHSKVDGTMELHNVLA
ncbi:MAG: tetratricopeptide repeat protein, partial [Pseudomonadota bacterium]